MSRRSVVLLPLAALLTAVAASLAGVGSSVGSEAALPGAPPDGATDGITDGAAEGGASDGAAERSSEGASDGATGGAGATSPPTTVDVVADREELLAAGRAVDAGGPDPGLQAALDAARVDARADGIELVVSSHHRSPEEQLRSLEQEIAERGSPEAALHWVFTPDRSMHVRGLAIDIGSGPAADWLEQHGARFGLCRTLDWEWWHFEWRQRWQDAGSCPTPASTPAEAPPP